VKNIMTPRDKLVTVKEGASLGRGAQRCMHRHASSAVLVINGDWELRGMMTVKDILKASEHPNAREGPVGSCASAAGVGRGRGGNRGGGSPALVEAGADVIVVGHRARPRPGCPRHA
jgi:IMP dehydrogenase